MRSFFARKSSPEEKNRGNQAYWLGQVPCPLGHRVGGLPKGYALLAWGMGVGFARNHAMAPLREHPGAKRLVAVRIVTAEGDTMGRPLLGMLSQPAFASGAFTVRFAMPILWQDVLRGQGNALGVARAQTPRGHGGMLREGLAIAAPTGETVLAMHGLGRTGSGAIEGHEQWSAQAPKMRHHVVLFKARKDRKKHRIAVAWCDRIEQRADLIGTGNLLHAPQGVGVSVAFGVLPSALGRQKRWRLGAKDAQGAQGGILDGISGIWPLVAMVRPLSDPSAQDALEGLEASGGCHGYLLGSMKITTLGFSVSIATANPLQAKIRTAGRNRDPGRTDASYPHARQRRRLTHRLNPSVYRDTSPSARPDGPLPRLSDHEGATASRYATAIGLLGRRSHQPGTRGTWLR